MGGRSDGHVQRSRNDAYSILVLLVAFGTLAALLGFLALMLERLRRRGALEAGLIHIVFLPERRRAFLRLITLLAIFFILSGLNATLVSVGAVNTLTENVVNSVAYAGGAISLLLLIWVGLRPVNLPADRKVGARALLAGDDPARVRPLRGPELRPETQLVRPTGPGGGGALLFPRMGYVRRWPECVA